MKDNGGIRVVVSVRRLPRRCCVVPKGGDGSQLFDRLSSRKLEAGVDSPLELHFVVYAAAPEMGMIDDIWLGSVVLPVLGAVPDGAIMLFSGLGSVEEAQENLAVGVGALAGSTIMLLTARGRRLPTRPRTSR